MKTRFVVFVVASVIGLGSMVSKAQCPFFSTPAFPDLTYNLNSTPWTFELQVFGDTTNAQIEWYRYPDGLPSSVALYTGPGCNTVSECYPQTDDAMRNTYYRYYCVIKTPSCPEGVTSPEFTVQVAIGSDCWMMGSTFRFESASSSYKEGETITLTAYYDGYSGYHYYTWFFNGDTLKEDANHVVYNDPDNFNYSVLTITNCQPSDAGSYSVTIRDGDCLKTIASPKTVTVKPREYLVFDDNNGTHIWSDPKNWWPNYNRIPLKTDTAVVRKRCNVDIADAIVGSLTIEMTGDTALIIHPQSGLVVTKLLHGCKKGDLLVQADATGNGVLALAPGNDNIPATVQFYAKSEQMGSAAPVWQYVGYPLQDEPLLSKAYEGAAMYEWTNTPNVKIGGNWQEMDGAAKAQSFRGYCMTESAQHTYSFSGTLNTPKTQKLDVPYNDQGTYPGFAFLANSWTAPIDISKMDVADFGAADATVYIMNTGTYEQAINQQPNMAMGEGTNAGQYNAIPVHAASYVAGGLSVIPPMQGFFVHTNSATTLQLHYNKTVYYPAQAKVTTTPTRIINHQSPITDDQSVETVLRLTVNGFGYSDVLYILVDENFTEGFDNGWDGRKAYSRSPLTLSALTSYGPSSVAAVPELDGLQLSVEGGLDKYYTITVTANPSPVTDNLYLYDKQTGSYTPLTDGAQYTYTFTGSSERFMLVKRSGSQEQIVKASKFIRDAQLYIDMDGVLYDAFGRKIGERK